MKPKILVTDPVDEEAIELLRNSGFEVECKYDISSAELKEIIGEYDAILVRSRTKVTREVIERGQRLRVIGRAGVGLDNIDLDAAQERNIKIISTPEAPSVAVAELTIGLILSLFRNIPLADSSMKEGKWIKKELIGKELQGKTIGLIGFGRIGKEVAKRAKAFGMHVIAYDVADIRDIASKFGVEVAPDLKYLLSNSDIVSIHVPLTSETYHLIGREEISLMKDGAYLVNTARGAVINGEALLEALRTGKLASAALDVYETEPPKGLELELIKLNNVIATPHIGASTEEAQRAAGMLISQKLIKTFKENI